MSRFLSWSHILVSMGMLAILDSLANPCIAQFKPVPYEFNDAPSTQIWHVITGASGNGYGIWGVDYRNNFWYLLSDTLTNHDTSDIKRAVPNGTVGWGLLNWSGQGTKVAANLSGAVRYVSIKEYGKLSDGFFIAGFNDAEMASRPGNVAPANIQIAFDSLSKKPRSREVVDSPYYYRDLVAHGAGFVGFPWKADAIEDLFDIAIDRNYLYVVWEEDPAPQSPKPLKEIWVAAVDLLTGRQLPDYPRLMTSAGRRPTIACDVRRGPTEPTYDVAWVTGPGDTIFRPQNALAFSYPHFDRVVVRSCEEGQLAAEVALTPIEKRPYAEGTTPYDFVGHARILVGSVQDGPTPAKAVYLTHLSGRLLEKKNPTSIYHLTETSALSLHRIHYDPTTGKNTPTAFATVVDDSLVPTRPLAITSQTYYVRDEPIVAFVSPYDGDSDANYSEFHCIYRVRVSTGVSGETRPSDQVLCIVRANENGCWATDSRTAFNKTKRSDGWVSGFTPFKYFGGAANQRGIYTYDFGLSNRSVRRIDEDIEENTLITHTTLFGDGTSHGGTKNIKLRDGKTLTMWTDPVWGVALARDSSGTGTFVNSPEQGLGWHNVKMKFVDPDVSLTIGDTAGATLVTLPNFELYFGPKSYNNAIRIAPGSYWRYYGRNMLESPVSTIFGSGTIELVGGGAIADTSVAAPPVALVKPATLDIRAGAEFVVSDNVFFRSVNSEILSSYGPSIIPIDGNNRKVNPGTGGSFVLHGTADISNSFLTSKYPKERSGTFFTVRSCADGTCNVSTDQLALSQVRIANVDSGYGLLRLESGSFAETFGRITVLHCAFLRQHLELHWPRQRFTLGHSTFRDVTLDALSIQGSAYIRNSIVSLHDNAFYDIRPGRRAILIADLSGAAGNLRVERNHFEQDTTLSLQPAYAALELRNSSGVVTENTVRGVRYRHGIVAANDLVRYQRSFFCKNQFFATGYDRTGAAFSSQNWIGDFRLNRIVGSAASFVSGYGDGGQLYFNFFGLNATAGLRQSSTFSFLDLSGLHAGDSVHAAYNTFDRNGLAQDPEQSQIEMLDSRLRLGDRSGTGSFYGRNTFTAYDPGSAFVRNRGSRAMVDGLDLNYWSDVSLFDPVVLTKGDLGRRFAGVPLPSDYTPESAPSFFSHTAKCEGLISVTGKGDGNDDGNGAGVSAGNGAGSGAGDPPMALGQPDPCAISFEAGYRLFQAGQFKLSFDTLRSYIERCYNEERSFDAFKFATVSVQELGGADSRWIAYRNWLVSVLDLNTTDARYRCQAMDAIVHTMFMDDPRTTDYNAAVSVIDHLTRLGSCQEMIEQLENTRKTARGYQTDLYRDTVRSPFESSMDTAAVSMESLGLGVLGTLGVGERHSASASPGIVAAISENPVRERTRLSVTMPYSASVTLTISDPLGRVVLPLGSTWRATGDFALPLDLTQLNPGSYYLRIESSLGDVATLKFVKR